MLQIKNMESEAELVRKWAKSKLEIRRIWFYGSRNRYEMIYIDSGRFSI